MQLLRETFSEADPYRYIIFDHDSKFNLEVIQLLTATGFQPKRTSIRAPWQNGIAERLIGSCRREMLYHIIPLNERHLRRLPREYAGYHNEDRIHDALNNKDAPNGRPSGAAAVASGQHDFTVSGRRPSSSLQLERSSLKHVSAYCTGLALSVFSYPQVCSTSVRVFPAIISAGLPVRRRFSGALLFA